MMTGIRIILHFNTTKTRPHINSFNPKSTLEPTAAQASQNT